MNDGTNELAADCMHSHTLWQEIKVATNGNKSKSWMIEAKPQRKCSSTSPLSTPFNIQYGTYSIPHLAHVQQAISGVETILVWHLRMRVFVVKICKRL